MSDRNHRLRAISIDLAASCEMKKPKQWPFLRTRIPCGEQATHCHTWEQGREERPMRFSRYVCRRHAELIATAHKLGALP